MSLNKLRKRDVAEDTKRWLSGLGLGPGIGDVFYLCASLTDNYCANLKENGISTDNVKADFEDLEDRMTADQNDVMVLMPGSHTLDTALTWDKSYTHIIGAIAPTVMNQRARLVNAAAAMTPMFTVSASGCMFKNFMSSQEGSHATTAAVNVYITGARNMFDHVTMRNIGAAAVVNDSMRNLKMASSDGENYFLNCTIGADTFDGDPAASACIEYVAGSDNGRNVFEECIILAGGSASAVFIKTGTNSAMGWQMFKRCLFSNNIAGTMDAMTQAFSLAGGNGPIFLMDSLVHGATCYESAESGTLFGRDSYAAATTDVAVALTF